jgi:hypothetical protein
MNFMVQYSLLALTAMVFCFGGAGIALADHPDNGPGCGLGKLAWSDYPHQQSVWAQNLQVTTNLTFFSQTFAISSGTSGCTNDGTILSSEKVSVFAAVNFDKISQEMAQGQGEHLTSLAILMDLPANQHQTFFAMAQEKYTTLIQSNTIPSHALIKILYDLPIKE